MVRDWIGRLVYGGVSCCVWFGLVLFVCLFVFFVLFFPPFSFLPSILVRPNKKLS